MQWLVVEIAMASVRMGNISRSVVENYLPVVG